MSNCLNCGGEIQIMINRNDGYCCENCKLALEAKRETNKGSDADADGTRHRPEGDMFSA